MTAWRAFKWELYKLVRRRISYLGFGVIALFCGTVALGFALHEFSSLRRFAALLPKDPAEYLNAFFFANFCLNISFLTLMPLFAAVIGGSQLAGEAKEGTLRILLTRPPSRPTLFFTKLLASYVWLQVQVYFLIGFALLLGWILVGGGDFLVMIWEFRDRTGPWVADSGDWVWMFLAAGFGAAMALMVVVSLAFAISALVDNPIIAHVGTLGVFFISSIIQRLPDALMGQNFKRFMPTQHLGFWHELYHPFHPAGAQFDLGRFLDDLKWSIGYSLVFLIIGFVGFCRRDIKC